MADEGEEVMLEQQGDGALRDRPTIRGLMARPLSAPDRPGRADKVDIANKAETANRPAATVGRSAPATAHSEPVRLSLPADRNYVVLARSLAAHIGARLGLTVDGIDDFRLAVDEACCLFLTEGQGTGDTLTCEFAESPEAVTVTVSAPVQGDFAGQQVDTFGWSLLESLVDGLWWRTRPGRAEVCLLMRRRPARGR